MSSSLVKIATLINQQRKKMEEMTTVDTYPIRIAKPMTNFSPHDSTARIDWNDCHCKNYYIRWWIDGKKLRESQTTIPTFTITDLQPGCRYNIQVAASNWIGQCGDYSDVLLFETAPNPPHNLQVIPGRQSPDSSFNVKFQYEEPSGIRFEVFWRSLTTGDVNKNVAEPGFTHIEGLTPGDTYDIWVVAIKGDVKSNSCKLEEPLQTYPAMVSFVSTEQSSSTSQTIKWKSVFGADSYVVKWKRYDGNYKTFLKSETEQTLTDLERGQSYKVCVAAVNSAGTGVYSDPVIFTTNLPSPSDIQCKVIYIGNNATLQVKFTNPDYPTIDKHRVTAETDTGQHHVTDTRTCHALISNLTEGSCYTVSVQVITMSGIESRKAYSNPIWTRPGRVTNISSQLITENSERVDWDAVPGAESYIVSVEEDGSITEYKTRRTGMALTNLTLDRRFSLTVAAVNQGGPGRSSNPISFATALSPPRNIQMRNIINSSESGIIVTWERCEGAVEYQAHLVEVATDEVISRNITDECCYKFYDLEPGCEYIASIRCISDIEKRNSSAACSGSIRTYCPQVTGLKSTFISPKSSNLHWDPQPTSTGYKLRFKPIDGNFEKFNVMESKHRISNLTLGKQYIANVSALNAAGEGKQSESILFRAGMAPPANVQVTNFIEDPRSTILVTFSEPENRPSYYALKAIGVSREHASKVHMTKTNFFLLTDLLPGLQYVVQVWSVSDDDETFDESLISDKVTSQKIWTCPDRVKDVLVNRDSKSTRDVTWTEVDGAISYIVTLKKAGSLPVSTDTDTDYLHLENLDLNSKYHVSVKAKNPGGTGKESDKVYFKTALCPPTNVRLENSTNNRTTGLVVRFDEPMKLTTRKYQLRFINLNDGSDKVIAGFRNVIEMNGLQPATKYIVGVSTIDEIDKELNSEEMFSNSIATLSPSLSMKTQNIRHNQQKVTWDDINNCSEYYLYWRIENRDWQLEIVHHCEFVLKQLKSGIVYEVYVVAINDGIPGERSTINNFVTVPAIPSKLSYRILSTQKVKLLCDPCIGSEGFIFNINGKEYNSEVPEYTLQCDGGVDVEFTVTSHNRAGKSRSSDVIKFRQVLKFLQEKFKKVAVNLLNTSKFVSPILTEVQSGDVVENFRSLSSQMQGAKTNLIIGEYFTGKTACCSYFTQEVSDDKLALLLDYEIVKNLTNKFDAKSLLREFMPELSVKEMEFVCQWMRDNSAQVVFVVDNFNLPVDFQPQNIAYDSEAQQNQVFYNLLFANRQIFPYSHVFCSTSQDFIRQILNCKAFRIDGFNESQITKMKENILDSETELSDVLKYFCTNPGFCQRILYWMKKGGTNFDSFSSVMIHLLYKNIQRYPPPQQKDKLNHILMEILNVPKRIEASQIGPEKTKKSKYRKEIQSQAQSMKAASLVSDGMSFMDNEMKLYDIVKDHSNCGSLQDFMNIALYFALFASVEDFKKQLEKNSLKFGSYANIWIMIAGLLKEESMQFAKKLFEIADVVISEENVGNKLRFIKKFIKQNMGRILQQIYIEPQITLDWFSCCNELDDDKLIEKCSTNIKITNKLKTDQIENIAQFLRRLPARFVRNVKVKYVCDDPTKTLPIDRAIKANPHGEIILLKIGSKKSISLISRKTSTYQPFGEQEISGRGSSIATTSNDDVLPDPPEDDIENITEPHNE